LAGVILYIQVDMTRCLDGGTLNTVKRLPRRPAIIFLVLASFLLAACTGSGADTNWPGMTADDQGVVYVAYGPAVLAVDVESNEVLWSFPNGEGNAAPFYARPTVVDGQVVFGDFGVSGGMLSPNKKVGVYSLDASSGALNGGWPISELAQDRIVAPALLVGDRIFIGTADNLVFALDANTAQPVWSEPFEADHSIWGKPAYSDGVIYVPSLDKHVYALDASDGSMIWQSSVEGSVSDNAVKNSGLVYVGSFDKNVYALDSQTGEIRWTAAAEAAVWGAPLYVDGTVYYADLNGNVYAVGAESGELIWENQADASYVIAQPVYADGKLFIASAGDPSASPDERAGALIAFDAEAGEQLWREPSDAPLFTTPVISGEKIVVAQEDPQTLLLYFSFDGDRTGSFARPVAG
jgi:outer membrane protein assembly factor BamB